MMNSVMTKTTYTAQDGMYNAIYKLWFPLANLLWHGGDAVVEAFAKLWGKKTAPKDFVYVKVLQQPKVIRVVALITSDGFTVAAMHKPSKQMKADREYEWHLVYPSNKQVHDSTVMFHLLHAFALLCFRQCNAPLNGCLFRGLCGVAADSQ